MSDVKQLTTAAAGIAELLEPLQPDQRQKAIDAALVLVKPARAARSDKGKPRKNDGNLPLIGNLGGVE